MPQQRTSACADVDLPALRACTYPCDAAAVGLRWLDQHLFPLIADDAGFLVLDEYGDFRVWRGERIWDNDAREFVTRYRELLKDRIAMIARAHGIGVKKDDRDYEPKSGELWFAPGAGVLSVRTNPNGYRFGTKLDADLVYKIAKQAIAQSGLFEEEFDVKKTPVSTVISRRGVNPGTRGTSGGFHPRPG